jgi:UDP-N-acetylglucosamine 2-epimerase
VADECIRHAVSKLAQLHFAASYESRERLIRMGEDERFVWNTGSPALDGIGDIEPIADEAFEELGGPDCVVLHHPTGLPSDWERAWAESLVQSIAESGSKPIVLGSNRDAGAEVVDSVFNDACAQYGWRAVGHLERSVFVGLLKRLAENKGVLVGNSSAGLIEASAVGIGVVNLGPRQGGRERWAGVFDVDQIGPADVLVQRITTAIHDASEYEHGGTSSPFGSGDAGRKIAGLLASVDLTDPALVRKRNRY